MTTVTTHATIQAPFNSAEDLINLFFKNPCKCLGVENGDKIATVQEKRKVKGINGWRITYGFKGKKAYILESKASAPSDFTASHFCSEGYQIIQYKDL